MPTWSGWILQFLVAANLPQTDENVTFLTDWTQHEQSSCRNNPVDVSRKVGNSTNCHKLTSSRTAQNYTSHNQAASAFNLELHSGNFPNLASALTGGTPLDKGGIAGIITDLEKWGSLKFADYLGGTYKQPPPTPGDTDAFKGWNDLRKSINKHLPAALDNAEKLRRSALRSYARAHKVKV